MIFPVFQNFPEDASVHRVRGDLGGSGSGRGHLQADRHQQGAGRSQLLCAEKTVRRGEGHNTNVHVSIIPICEISQFEINLEIDQKFMIVSNLLVYRRRHLNTAITKPHWLRNGWWWKSFCLYLGHPSVIMAFIKEISIYRNGLTLKT